MQIAVRWEVASDRTPERERDETLSDLIAVELRWQVTPGQWQCGEARVLLAFFHWRRVRDGWERDWRKARSEADGEEEEEERCRQMMIMRRSSSELRRRIMAVVC